MFNHLQGCGLGLRSPHFNTILKTKPPIPWFEILADNYLQPGPALDALLAIREHYPVTQHSVGMSLGSIDPLNWDYLTQLRDLANLIEPQLISDHLCFVSVNKRYYHDLLPLPYTAEAVSHVAERIKQVQDFLGRRIAIENVSSYLTYTHSEMTEAQFIASIAAESDCQILLDVNNSYVNSFNHEFELSDFFAQLPLERIVQYHLSGHESREGYLLDTHGAAVADSVWNAYRLAIQQFGALPTLIEWDNELPDFSILAAEAEKCAEYAKEPRQVIQPRQQTIRPASNRPLATLQQAWWQYLNEPQAITSLVDHIAKQGSLTPSARLAIYHNLYQTNLVASLAATFSVTAQLIGPDLFQQIAKQYINTFDSRSPNLNHYGDQFPEFISTIAEVASLPYLSDVATLEWLYQQSNDSLTPTLIDWQNTLNHFNQVGLELRVTLQSHVRLLQSPYPIDEIWHWHQQSQQEPLQLSTNSVQILVAKPMQKMEITRLEADAFAWISELRPDKTLAELIKQHPDWDSAQLVAMLQMGSQRNWLECANHHDESLGNGLQTE